MALDHRSPQLGGMRQLLSVATAPLQYIADLPVATASWLGETLISRQQLQKENRFLRDRQVVLDSQLQRLIALEAENAQLRTLLGSEKRSLERRLVAEVLAVDNDPLNHLVVINKGSHDGVFEGQPVLDTSGIVGQVRRVGLLTSQILLITDTTHGLPVRNSRTGVRAIAQGVGKLDMLDIRNVPNSSDMKAGDILVTSGLDQKFPEGYPVARVSLMAHEHGQPFAHIEAVPLAQLARLRQVLLLWPIQSRYSEELQQEQMIK
jgi:rod shape-determining protein MreC